MKRSRSTFLISVLLVSACSPRAPNDPVVVVPAPTPTPAPSPTPTPPASPAYGIAFDFSRDFTFTTQEARINYTVLAGTPASGPVAFLNDPGFGVVRYQRAAGQFQSDLDVFADQFVEVNSAIERRYTIPAGSQRAQSFSFRVPSTDFRYVAFGSYALPLARVLGTTQDITTAAYRYHLIGVPTLVSDVPASGVSTYTINYICTLLTAASASVSTEITASLTVNHGTGVVSGALPNNLRSCFNNGTTVRPASLSFTGTLDSRINTISGTISSPDSNFSGTFTGQLFGPAAIEMGLVFIVNNGGEAVVAGQVVGRRGQ